MFNPTRDEARRFFMDAWRKRRDALPATPLETIAADLASIHPEYQRLLEGGAEALSREWTPDDGAANPFLHLSLHLAIEEQLSIDQPPGIRAAFDRLLERRGNRHDALHGILDCLGETVFRAARNGTAPDGDAYLECVRRAAAG